jgi:hypothetical protein
LVIKHISFGYDPFNQEEWDNLTQPQALEKYKTKHIISYITVEVVIDPMEKTHSTFLKDNREWDRLDSKCRRREKVPDAESALW